MHDVDAVTARSILRTRIDLRAEGWSDRHLAAAVAASTILRVRRGWYVRAEDWNVLWPQSRHLVHVVAAHSDAQESPVFVLTSAAVVHGLPLFRSRTSRVHTAHAGARRRSGDAVVRHDVQLASDEIVEVGGIRCTSLERTVFDLLRLASPEVALVCADAALARIGGDPRDFDRAAAECWLDEVAARVDAAATARGIRQARTLLEIADGRSEQPLEVVTKLQLRRLGFAQPRLQVTVPAPHGGSYWMDIALDEVNAFYECDGEGKYLDEATRSGRSLDEVLFAEKKREDWVRGTTGRRVVRGGSEHAVTPEALAAHLSAFGIALPDRRKRLLLPKRPLLHGQ